MIRNRDLLGSGCVTMPTRPQRRSTEVLQLRIYACAIYTCYSIITGYQVTASLLVSTDRTWCWREALVPFRPFPIYRKNFTNLESKD